MVTKSVAIQLQELNKDLRHISRADTRDAILGDTNGIVWVGSGLANVRYTASSGNTDNLSWPTVVKFERNLPDEPGTPVVIGLDDEYEIAVLKVSTRGALQSNRPPTGGITGNNTLRQTDITLVPYLKSFPVGPSAPLYMVTMPFQYVRGITYNLFSGSNDDMSSYVPATANMHKLVGVFLKPDNTLEYPESTNKDFNDVLSDSDIQEVLDNASVGSIPGSIWRFYYGQTEISDTDLWWDMRQWINIPDYQAATVTTTDATATTLASISVSELQMMTITATVNGRKSDYSAAIGGTATATVRRATGGNVILVGSTSVTSNEDSAGTPSFTIDVDTGTQTARLRVTGIAAETWYWTAQYKQVVS